MSSTVKKSWQVTEKVEDMTLVVESDGGSSSYIMYHSGTYMRELVTRQLTLAEAMKFNDLSQFSMKEHEIKDLIMRAISQKIRDAVGSGDV